MPLPKRPAPKDTDKAIGLDTVTGEIVQPPPCKWGSLCYRRNPEHLAQFSHPNRVAGAATSAASINDARWASPATDASSEKRRPISDDPRRSADSGERGAGSKPIASARGRRGSSIKKGSPTARKAGVGTVKPKPPLKALAFPGVLNLPAFPPSVTGATSGASSGCSPAIVKTETISQSRYDVEDGDDGHVHRDKVFLEMCYDMPFPDDFFDLWDLCVTIASKDPREALADLIGYRLAGPYDALALKETVDPTDKRVFNLHCRYYYDPPELQTVLVAVDSDCHIGYFRDDPNELPVFAAQSQLHRKDIQPWKLVIVGCSLMQVVHVLLKDKIKVEKDSQKKGSLEDMLLRVTKMCQKKHLLSYKSKRKARAVGNVFHHVGMVVPYDPITEVGYRPLTVTNVQLRSMMQQVVNAKPENVKFALSPIQELITLVNFANDECDYGMGLELGLDLFLFGHERLHPVALFLLQTAYTLVNRPKFFEIVRDHIDCRNHVNVNYLSVQK